MGLWHMAHFSSTLELQQQDGRRDEKAQNNLSKKENNKTRKMLFVFMAQATWHLNKRETNSDFPSSV